MKVLLRRASSGLISAAGDTGRECLAAVDRHRKKCGGETEKTPKIEASPIAVRSVPANSALMSHRNSVFNCKPPPNRIYLTPGLAFLLPFC